MQHQHALPRPRTHPRVAGAPASHGAARHSSGLRWPAVQPRASALRGRRQWPCARRARSRRVSSPVRSRGRPRRVRHVKARGASAAGTGLRTGLGEPLPTCPLPWRRPRAPSLCASRERLEVAHGLRRTAPRGPPARARIPTAHARSPRGQRCARGLRCLPAAARPSHLPGATSGACSRSTVAGAGREQAPPPRAPSPATDTGSGPAWARKASTVARRRWAEWAPDDKTAECAARGRASQSRSSSTSTLLRLVNLR